MWIVTKVADGGWEELASNEFRIPGHANEFAERKSKEELGTEFRVHRLVPEMAYSSKIVTTTNEVG